MTGFVVLWVLLAVFSEMLWPGTILYLLFWSWIAYAAFRFIVRPVGAGLARRFRATRQPREGFAELGEFDPEGRWRRVGHTAYKEVPPRPR